jgi:hypothetical protein
MKVGPLRMFENNVPRTIFGPNKNEVKAKRIKLFNEQLNNLGS